MSFFRQHIHNTNEQLRRRGTGNDNGEMGSFSKNENVGKKQLGGQNNPAHTHARQLFCHEESQLTSASPDAGRGGTRESGSEPTTKPSKKTGDCSTKKRRPDGSKTTDEKRKSSTFRRAPALGRTRGSRLGAGCQARQSSCLEGTDRSGELFWKRIGTPLYRAVETK